MTPQDALNAGELQTSIDLQTEIVATEPRNPAARLLLAELLLLSGQLNAARDELLELDEPDNQVMRIWNLVKAQSRRRKVQPRTSGKWPDHARLRLDAWRTYRRNKLSAVADLIDEADAISPHLQGCVDGREFDGVRDSDDRFASVLEVFLGRDYTWIPLEHLQQVELGPIRGVADIAFRPARIQMRGQNYQVCLPLIYPETHREADDELMLGRGTDYPVVDPSITIAVGSKMWQFGDDLIGLGECRLIEFLPQRG